MESRQLIGFIMTRTESIALEIINGSYLGWTTYVLATTSILEKNTIRIYILIFRYILGPFIIGHCCVIRVRTYLQPKNSIFANVCPKHTTRCSSNLPLFSSMNFRLRSQWCFGSVGLKYFSTLHPVSNPILFCNC